MPNVPPLAVRPPVDGTRSWVALGVSAAVHAVLITFALLNPPVTDRVDAAPLVPDGNQVALAPQELPPLAEAPEPDAPRERDAVRPPQDAVPLGPDSPNPDAPIPREAGPVEPEPEILPDAAPDRDDTPPAEVQPNPAPMPAERVLPRIPTAMEYSSLAMSRLRSPSSPFGPPPDFAAAPPSAPAERPSTMGAGGRVGMSNRPDTRDWRPSSPEAAGRCVEIPDLGKNPDGSPVLASVEGRVYEADGRTPLVGAHLVIVGTRFTTFSSSTGDYRLQFDPKLLTKCQVQYVRVAADGYAGRMLTLSIGQKIRSDDVLLRRR